MLYQPFLGIGAKRTAFLRRDRFSQDFHASMGVHVRQTAGHDLFTGLVDWWPMSELCTTGGIKKGRHFGWQLSAGGFSATEAGLNNTLASKSTSAGQSAASIVSNSTLQIGSGISFSLSCWVKFAASFASGSLMAKDNGTSAQREFNLNVVNTGVMRMQYGNGTTIVAGGNVQTGTGAVVAGTWYHIVGIYDAQTPLLSIIINTSATSNTPTTVAGSSSADFTIASDSRATRLSIDGLIQRCGYWKRALTTDEVALLYAGGAGLDYPFIV